MNDINMQATVIPKSDQLNYDDISDRRTKTIRITKVTGSDGDQPVSLHYEGDNGKPYKPCKSMRRVIINVWGDKSSKYPGQAMTIFGDPEVVFGGMKVGGIRISHITGINETKEIPLTTTRGKRKPYIVHPLVVQNTAPVENIDSLKSSGRAEAEKGKDALKAWWGGLGGVKQNQLGSPFLEELKRIADKPAPAATSELQDDGFSDNRE